MAADIRNTYLRAPTFEMHFIICGEDFGIENVGKWVLLLELYMAEKLLEETFGIIFEAA